MLIGSPKIPAEVATCTRVQCSLTVDNVIQEVKYNHVKLSVSGQLNNWKKENSFAFQSCNKDDPGKLTIQGLDHNRDKNCEYGGLLLHCTASDRTSLWHNFKSDAEHWRDEKGQFPCQNDLLFPKVGLMLRI